MNNFRGVEPSPDTQHYTVAVICENCFFKGELTLELGLLVKNTPCPECGNRALERQTDWQKPQERR